MTGAFDRPAMMAWPSKAALLTLLLVVQMEVRRGSAQSPYQVGGVGLDCDGVEGSGKRVDRCGVCGGEDVGCKVMTGLFTQEDAGRGYVDIATIPKGAVNVNITERAPSRNYLVLLYKDSQKSILNGDWTLSWSGEYSAAGTVFVYDRPREGLGESVFARGPLADYVQLQILSQARNPGVIYEYSLPVAALEYDDLAPATLTASGRDDASAQRIRDDAADGVADAHYAASGQRDAAATAGSTPRRAPEKPEVKSSPSQPHGEPLNLVFIDDRQPYDGYGVRGLAGGRGQWPAAGVRVPGRTEAAPGGGGGESSFQWRVSQSLGACSATCGEGTQEQRVLCVKVPAMVAVPDEKCSNLVRPDSQLVRCSLPPCKARWEVSEWTTCSVTCGRGTQSRVVECRRETSPGYTVAVPPAACGARKPSALQTCRLSACPVWRTGNWSECSATCGTGERSRSAWCADAAGEAVADAACSGGMRPRTKEPCRTPCVGAWFYSDWEDQCSADCAEGYLSRRVYCVVPGVAQTAVESDSDASACPAAARPESTRPCKGSELCRPGRWFVGQWSECAGSCPDGEQRREIVCLRQVGQWRAPTHETECSQQGKPDNRRKCRPRACDAEPTGEWYVTEYSPCSATCDSGVRRREIRCLARNSSGSGAAAQCDELRRPKETQSCEMAPCFRGPECTDKHVVCRAASESGLCQLVQYSSLCCASCSATRT